MAGARSAKPIRCQHLHARLPLPDALSSRFVAIAFVERSALPLACWALRAARPKIWKCRKAFTNRFGSSVW